MPDPADSVSDSSPRFTEGDETAARIRYANTLYHWLMAKRYGYRVICVHKSHRLRLPCFRGRTYDGYCGRHNATCFGDDFAGPNARRDRNA